MLPIAAWLEKQKMVANLPLFSEFSSTDIDFISSHGVIKSYPKHALILNEGDETDFICIILDGLVKVYVSDDNGKEVILSIQGPGEYFGELALIDEVPRSASVMTLKPSRLVLVSQTSFKACLTENPALALKLIRSLTHRIRLLTEIVKNLALQDVYGRVVRTLVNLAEEKEEGLVLDQKLTHQDLANMVGASREMVTRILKELNSGGYIQIRNKIITIKGKLPPAW